MWLDTPVIIDIIGTRSRVLWVKSHLSHPGVRDVAPPLIEEGECHMAKKRKKAKAKKKKAKAKARKTKRKSKRKSKRRR